MEQNKMLKNDIVTVIIIQEKQEKTGSKNIISEQNNEENEIQEKNNKSKCKNTK